MDFIQTWIGRVLAVWIAGLCTWLLVHFGVAVDTAQQKAFVEHLVGVIIPILLTIFSILHKLFDRHFNPGDAASTHIAAKESREAAQLRRP